MRDAELSVNESALTGESVPAHKTEAVLAEGTIVADRTNMVYSGTLVTSGNAAGVVVATGGIPNSVRFTDSSAARDVSGDTADRRLSRFSKVLTVGDPRPGGC